MTPEHPTVALAQTIIDVGPQNCSPVTWRLANHLILLQAVADAARVLGPGHNTDAQWLALANAFDDLDGAPGQGGLRNVRQVTATIKHVGRLPISDPEE
jgi:hypothetical protein